MIDPIRDYLAHCYLYYTLADTAINDHEFDALCGVINRDWEHINSNWKEYLLTVDNLPIKGTELPEDKCPPEIKRYALRLLEDRRAEEEIFNV